MTARARPRLTTLARQRRWNTSRRYADVSRKTPNMRAILSVSDKTGLLAFARGLVDHGVQLVSTGGTANAIAAAGLPVTSVSDVTDFPEMMDGRVKTLHPKIH